MMESASVVSENVQPDENFKTRPCEFVPPPPPNEPPPADVYPATDYSMSERCTFVDKGTVVGDDNISLAPASLKSSPVAGTIPLIHSIKRSLSKTRKR